MIQSSVYNGGQSSWGLLCELRVHGAQILCAFILLFQIFRRRSQRKVGSLLGSALSFELILTHYARTADTVIETVEKYYNIILKCNEVSHFV